jgi:L-amino acid N-acyltransferase YncA
MLLMRDVCPSDAAAICAIYNHYVTSTIITFEEVAVSERDMAARISEVTSSYPWIVCVENDAVVGYAYAARWKARSAYRHTVEVTVYVAAGATGRGLGTQLMAALLSRLRQHGDIHAAIGGVSLPNPASIALQEKFGFKPVGRFHETGRKFDNWIDVGYWELIL